MDNKRTSLDQLAVISAIAIIATCISFQTYRNFPAKILNVLFLERNGSPQGPSLTEPRKPRDLLRISFNFKIRKQESDA